GTEIMSLDDKAPAENLHDTPERILARADFPIMHTVIRPVGAARDFAGKGQFEPPDAEPTLQIGTVIRQRYNHMEPSNACELFQRARHIIEGDMFQNLKRQHSVKAVSRKVLPDVTYIPLHIRRRRRVVVEGRDIKAHLVTEIKAE